MNRSPLSEFQMTTIELRLYPDWQSPVRIEGVELDIAMEQARLNENNVQWLSRQARGLRREFQGLSHDRR